MSINITSQAWSAARTLSKDNPSTPGASNNSSAQSSFQSVLDQLHDYANGTAADRMEQMVLAQLGVTKEQLEKMSPEERTKIMDRAREMLKIEMQAQRQREQTVGRLQNDLTV
jgi:acyl-CoA reductase-like NAD-dependent aldehyde dehydrogenase